MSRAGSGVGAEPLYQVLHQRLHPRWPSAPRRRGKVHFETPPAERLPEEIGHFLGWLNGPAAEPALIRAGLGHLWFVTLHPFDDGNGRIARAIGDLLLARADGSTHRFYSLSAQI